MDDATLLAYQGLQTSAGLLGSYASAMTGYKNNRKLMLLQNELNQQAIEKQNEYNLPKNQMIRLTDAGLNPNLVYGSGSVVGNTSEASKVGLGHSDSPRYDQVLMYNNLAMQKAQIANIEADTRLKQENADTQESVRKRNISQSDYMDYFTNWNYLTWDERKLTLDLQNAIYKRQYGLIGYYMANLESTINQRDQLTVEQVATMAQARLVQMKQFDLSEKNLEQQWKHWKNQDAIGFKNASALMVSALAAQLQAKAAGENAVTNRFNAETARGYLKIAQDTFDKMSDLQQAKLREQVLSDIAYRQNYINYLGPFMETRISMMDATTGNVQSRTNLNNQALDLNPMNLTLDFLKFGGNTMNQTNW